MLDILTPKTHTERREALYQSMEAKIKVVSAVWASAASFPTVEHVYSRNQFFMEKNILHEPLSDYYYSQEKEDKPFFQRFEHKLLRGINAAAHRRMRIRTALKEFGDSWVDPMVYRQEISSIFAPLLPAVAQVVPGRFSINLIVGEQGFFEEYLTKEGLKPVPEGFHIPNTWINFIKAVPFESDQNSSALLRFEEAKSHEDFHSFADGFMYPHPEDVKAALKTRQSALVQAILRSRKMDQGLLSYPFDLGTNLKELVDKSHEELVAELVSSNSGELPKRTFAHHMKSMRARLLKEAQPGGPASAKIAQYGDYIDIERYRDILNDLYDQAEGVGRGQDFLTALAIFPPSQMRHVRRLVERWVA